MFTVAQLPKNAALLDLISEAAAAPEAVRERAHALAATHAVAPPEQVDRALAHLVTVNGDWSWDRPATLSEYAVRRERLMEEKQHLQKKMAAANHAFLPNNVFEGFLLGSCVAVLVLLSSMPFPLSSFLSSCFQGVAAVGGLGLLVCGVLRQKPYREAQRVTQPRLSDCLVKLNALKPYAPGTEQMERWLAHPEVTEQARAWLTSPCGLMTGDAERLDAWSKALEAQRKEAHRLDLARRLTRPA